MKFGCDSCHAQYMISDQKVGPAGVRVRCKKCGFVIHVRSSGPEPEDATMVMSAEKVLQLQQDIGLPPPAALPKPTEDEIGQAFDSMFSAPAAPAEPSAPPTDPENPAHEPDRVETRILGPSDVQKIASELGPSLALAAAAKEDEPTLAAAPPAVEWFAAIADEQVGPLDVAAIEERWKRGDLRPNSLVWRAGFSDWKPLSSVGELAALAPAAEEIPRLAPVRSVEVMEPEAPPESAVEPAPTVIPPPEETPAEAIDFRPSAAEALASLASMAQEEIAASAPAASGGPNDVAPAAEARRDPLADLPAPAVVPTVPVLAATTDGAEVPRPFGASDGRGRFGSPERSPFRLALVVGGATLAGILVVVAIVWFALLRPERERQREQEKRLAALAASAALAQKAAPAPKAPAAPATSAAPVAPAADAQPAAPAAPAAKPPAPAAVAQASSPAPERSRERASEGGRGRHHNRSRAAGEKKTAAASAEVAAAAPAAAPQGGGDDFLGGTGTGGIDKEFARELDGKGAAGSERSGDIAPAADAVPASLSQADVLSVVRDHTSSFLHCKDQHPPGGGRIVMHWRIRPDGRPADVRRSGGDLDNPALVACLKTAVGRMRFGQSRNSTPVDFPFDF